VSAEAELPGVGDSLLPKLSIDGREAGWEGEAAMPRLIASRTRLPCFRDVEKDRGATEDPDTARGGMLGIAGGVPTWAGEGSVGWGDAVDCEGAADWRGCFESPAPAPAPVPGTCLGNAMLREREDELVDEGSD
jgi:hypothetical protein